MKRTTKSAVLAASVLLALAAGAAYATIPDAQGVIHACYDNQSGQVRIVDTAPNPLPKGCGAKESAISWNQTGPAGPAGVLGFYTVQKGVDVPAHEHDFESLDCDPGDRATGGGYAVDPNHLEDVRVADSGPTNELVGGKLVPFAWLFAFVNSSDSPTTVQFSVICADLTA
jgi:hypothetical protein